MARIEKLIWCVALACVFVGLVALFVFAGNAWEAEAKACRERGGVYLATRSGEICIAAEAVK